jgi:hypothetical protein
MKPTPIATYFTPSLLRRYAALALALTVVGACSDDEEAPAPQPDFSVAVSSLDGLAPDQAVELQCDGKVVVAVAISSSIDDIQFTLRPAGACGSSKRCGYVRVEALGSDDELLGRTETTTTAAVLPLPLDRLAEVKTLRATLMSGVDKTPIVNKDGTQVTASVSPESFTVRSDCPDPAGGAGEGGAAGQGGAGGAGGVGGGAGGAVTSEGGAAGTAGADAAAGAGGATEALGGAGAGGELTGAGALASGG